MYKISNVSQKMWQKASSIISMAPKGFEYLLTAL